MQHKDPLRNNRRLFRNKVRLFPNNRRLLENTRPLPGTHVSLPTTTCHILQGSHLLQFVRNSLVDEVVDGNAC